MTTYSTFFEPDGTRLEDELSGYTPYGNWTRILDRHNAAGSCSALLRRRVFERGFRYSHRPDELRGLVPVPRAGGGRPVRDDHPRAPVPYRVRPQSMLRELGAPLVERYAGELRAYLREAEVRWTADDAATLGLPA